MSSLPNNVYHLVYHDVGPSASSWTRRINSTISPSAFEEDLAALSRHGEIISTKAALDLSRQGVTPHKPHFALWFDDGYSGVAEYAQAICQQRGIQPAIAVNARFARQDAIFWRCQLGYLFEILDVNVLWERLLDMAPPPGTDPAAALWSATLRGYNRELRERLDTCYQQELAADQVPADLFMDEAQLRSLGNEGWLLANHSASHPAITPDTALEDVLDDFAEGHDFLASLPGGQPDVWVMPFDYDVVKTAVDAQVDQYLQHADLIVRADPLPVPQDHQLGRMTISPGKPALQTLINHQRKRSPLHRLKRRLLR